MPRILVAIMEDDYGIPEQGPSSELHNLLRPLQKLYPGTDNFDYMRRARAIGRDAMNAELIGLVASRKPEITIVNLFGGLIRPETVTAMRRWTTTVAYFYDDYWQRSESVFWSAFFDLITTGDPKGVQRLARAGVHNAIYSPYTFNEELHVRRGLSPAYDISFVGLTHPYREWIIDRLARAGHSVTAFGHGWTHGRIPIEAMVEVFERSRINLNLSNSSHWDLPFLVAKPLAIPLMLKQAKHREQMKTRHFEIPACGGFQLSFDVPWLGEYFVRGEEIAIYRDADELIDKAAYYLQHEDERLAITEAGWRRAHREHAAGKRLRTLVDDILERSRSAAS